MKIKEFYWRLREFICNKSKQKVVKTVFNGRPFDFSYMLQVELNYMKYMKEYFDNSKYTDKPARELNWAINILQLILSDDYWGYDYWECSKKQNGTYSYDGQYVCKVYVNTKNIKRFFTKHSDISEERYNNIIQYMLEHKHELYRAKLWYLYNVIRERYMQTWWD